MTRFYALMCVVGTVLPLSAFVPWVLEFGLDLNFLLSGAFVNRVAAFAWLDVIVSAVVLLVFIWVEGRRQGMTRLWLPTLGTCTVGVSLGLPLFLLLRERHRSVQSARPD
ncbi:MAG: DUF2834 domain-containing protein [Pseudomonadota bacterium]